MDWSRAKNLLIAILVCVNVFLIVTYIMRENETRTEVTTLRNDVADILTSQGIEVDAELIPSDSVEISYAVLSASESGLSIAGKLFGNVSESVDAGSTTYIGENGNIMFSREAFSLVYESGDEVTNEQKAVVIAENLISKMSVSTDRRKFICSDIDGGYIIEVPQVFSGITVFDAGIEFRISDSGSVIAHGKFIGYNSFGGASGDVRRASGLMLDFADAVRNEGYERVKVEKIELGYFSEIRSDEVISLIPMMKITTDSGDFGIDISSGSTQLL